MDRRDFLKTGSVASMVLLPKVPIIEEYEVREYNDRTEWYLKMELHREDGPAVEYKNGDKEYWYLNGKLHREDGPAIEYKNKFWYLNGKKHRDDGPAVEWLNGDKEWWANGKMLSYNYDIAEEKKFTIKIIRKIKFS